jgi:Carboxypeptidase regulatory-like domain/TonB-dependent Receptor Plug Domain/TonB dependent receptor-like, beta-barrel
MMRIAEMHANWFSSIPFFGLLLLTAPLAAQQPAAVIQGHVRDEHGAPITQATIRVEGTTLSAATDQTGAYRLDAVPAGPQIVRVQRLGYVPNRLPVTVPVRGELALDITMATAALELEGITVTADAPSRAPGEVATATVIGAEAIRHQTATSVAGVLELVPGMQLSAPSLSDVQEISLRAVSTSGLAGGTSATDLAAFGTLIVLDGVPLSNNANLQSLGPRGELSFTTAANGGVDLRQIPAATLDRVEVIRGLPPVRYGDLTQGAIIVDTRVGAFAPELRVQYDALTTEATALGGWNLGRTHGVTANLDYARTRSEPGVTTDLADRLAGQLRHSARLGLSPDGLSAKLTLDSRADFYRLADDRPENPNTRPGYSSRSRDAGLRVSERAQLQLAPRATLEATASVSREWQTSYVETQLARGAMPFTNRTTPGTSEGFYVLGSYTSQLTVDGDPWLVYGRVEATAPAAWLGLSHRLRAGAEFRREWNTGAGYQFDMEFPPQVLFNGVQGYDRPRSFAGIPGLATSGVYADDRATGLLFGRLDYSLQAGLRLDVLHENASWLPNPRDAVLQPRISAEIAPWRWLRFHGAWGRTAKAPALADLYPAPQYNDVVNVNWFANDPAERLAVLTTFIFDPTNPDLGFSTADKAEVGFDLGTGGSVISVVGFRDRISGGVGFRQDLTYLLRDHYQLTDSINGNGIKPEIIQPPSSSDTVPVLVDTPANYLTAVNEGVELVATLPEIPHLRTRFQIQGSFVRTDRTSDAVNVGSPTRFSDFQLSSVQQRAPYWLGSHERGERYLLTYRLIHHQPALGLVVTATVQHNLRDFLDDIGSRDTLGFAGYITRAGQLVPVPPADRTLPQYQDLRVPRGGLIAPQATPADWMMGIQVSKALPLEGELRFWAFNALDRVGRYPAAGEAARVYQHVQFGVEVNLQPGAIARAWR